MQYVTRVIPTSYDRDWIAATGAFIVNVEPVIEEGATEVSWLFCTNDVPGALDLIDNYAVRYLEKRLPDARLAIEARAQEEFLGGFTIATGPLAGHVLQVRDMEDRTNWLASQVAYTAAISAGAGAIAGATFRTADNVTVTCTFSEGSDTLLAMQSWGKDIMHRAWALKDACTAATDITALDLVLADIDTGWPSSV